nr:apoptosis-enhancing nuclease isoform X1 [Equus asinus]XP_044617474.1 apoptosis-enhancing nuclease isoform X1 [Equus asinus]
MVTRQAPEPAQCLCPSLASPTVKDVLRRKHKRKSRQHQRFMARKALLQEQGLLSTPPEPGSSPTPVPADTPLGTEAASRENQRPRTESGGVLCSRKPAPWESAGPLPSKCVAIDCEMVGTGPHGRVSELARCSVVSYHGDVLYDKYVRPEMPIVDYRTRWSGITRQHMRKAIPFQVAQKEILKLLKGKVVVGHALHNDFQALKYVHPRSQTRDTTYVPNLLNQPGLHTRTRVSLKDLALQLLHKKIQVLGSMIKRRSPASTSSSGCFLHPSSQCIVRASHILPGRSLPRLCPPPQLQALSALHVNLRLLQAELEPWVRRKPLLLPLDFTFTVPSAHQAFEGRDFYHVSCLRRRAWRS